MGGAKEMVGGGLGRGGVHATEHPWDSDGVECEGGG